MEKLCTSDRVNSPISQYGGGGGGSQKVPNVKLLTRAVPNVKAANWPGGPMSPKYEADLLIHTVIALFSNVLNSAAVGIT